MSIDAELTLQADGGITGSMSMMDQEVLLSGSFDTEASTIELNSIPVGRVSCRAPLPMASCRARLSLPWAVAGRRHPSGSRVGSESDATTDEDDVELASELPEPNRDLPVPLGG